MKSYLSPILIFATFLAGFIFKEEIRTFLTSKQARLLDPEMSPPVLHDSVMRGYKLLLYTDTLLNENVGAHLTCANCHFNAGITTGGNLGGISLVAVTTQYPKYKEETKEIETLTERINQCFSRSMNGSALHEDSEAMKDILTFLSYISTDYPVYGKTPWLGVKTLRSNYIGNPARGEKLFATKCATCHGASGQGKNSASDGQGTNIPPVMGNKTFSKDAGMSNKGIFASFIYHNMPYNNPSLSEEEAIDIAAFVTSSRE